MTDLEEEREVTKERYKQFAKIIQQQYKEICELKRELKKVMPDNEMLSEL